MAMTLDVAHCLLKTKSATSVHNKAVTRNVFKNSMLRGQCYNLVLEGQGPAIFRPRPWPNDWQAKSDIFKAQYTLHHYQNIVTVCKEYCGKETEIKQGQSRSVVTNSNIFKNFGKYQFREQRANATMFWYTSSHSIRGQRQQILSLMTVVEDEDTPDKTL